MSNQCLIAEYATIEAANVGLEVLQSDDFTPEEVSVVTRQHATTIADEGELVSQSSDSPSTGKTVALGAIIGGAIATPLAVGTMIGPFFIAGPLIGILAGAAVGGVLKSVAKWGVDNDAAERYEQRVAEGAILILVSTDDSIRLNDAEQLLRTTSPESLEQFHLAGV